MTTKLEPRLAEFDRQLEIVRAKPEGEERRRAMDELRAEWLPVLREMRAKTLPRPRRRRPRFRGVGVFIGFD
jgi:hypothetical protein